MFRASAKFFENMRGVRDRVQLQRCSVCPRGLANSTEYQIMYRGICRCRICDICDMYRWCVSASVSMLRFGSIGQGWVMPGGSKTTGHLEEMGQEV